MDIGSATTLTHRSNQRLQLCKGFWTILLHIGNGVAQGGETGRGRHDLVVIGIVFACVGHTLHEERNLSWEEGWGWWRVFCERSMEAGKMCVRVWREGDKHSQRAIDR